MRDKSKFLVNGISRNLQNQIFIKIDLLIFILPFLMWVKAVEQQKFLKILHLGFNFDQNFFVNALKV